MKLTNLVIPPWVKPALCGIAVVAAFSAGWTVNGWRWQAKQTHALEAQQKQFQAQLAKQGKEATAYENDRQAAREATDARQTQVRIIYRDKVVPRGCDPDPAAKRLLDDAIRDANSASGSQPSGTVPDPSR